MDEPSQNPPEDYAQAFLRLSREDPTWLAGLFDDFGGPTKPKPPLVPAKPVYVPPPDLQLAQLIRHPAVGVILGHRGSGKSALALRLQELKRTQAAPYAVGLPTRARVLLPDWYGLADDPSTLPSNTVIYFPEAYRAFHARTAQSRQGRTIGDLINLSRHRRQTLLFDVQNPAHLDRNIISEADVLLIKQPGPLTAGFERRELRAVMDAAREAFSHLPVGQRKRFVWMVAPAQNEPGRLMENLVPVFWTDGISRIFSEVVVSTAPTDEQALAKPLGWSKAPRKGRQTSPEEKQAQAMSLREAGLSYGEIAKALSISKSQAYRYLHTD